MNNENAKWHERDEKISNPESIPSPAIDKWNEGQRGVVGLSPAPAPAREIDSAFAVHVLNEGGIKMAQEIAWTFNATWRFLQRFCPPGREMSIVHTKLEEACFFAKKAMASDLQNQKNPAPYEPQPSVND